jgi:putative phage-type endonuclease
MKALHESTLAMTEEQWLERRSSSIGSSDIGAILGLNKYKTPRDLFNEKAGIVPPFEGNESTRWGSTLEDWLTQMFVEDNAADMKGYKVQRDNKIRVHPEYKWATCNLDRLIVGSGDPTILELKTTVGFVVRSWPKEEPVPANYYAQLQWQMFVTGYKAAIIWVGVLDEKRFIRLDVVRNDDFIGVMFKEAQEFNNAMTLKDPSNLKMTVSDLDKIKPVAGTRIEANDEIIETLNELATLKEGKAVVEKEEKDLTETVKKFIGENEALVQGDAVLATYRTFTRKEYVVKGGTYRQLSIKKEKEAKP